MVAADTLQPVILGVVLNGVSVSGGETFLEVGNAHLLASASFLKRLNLRAGTGLPRLVDGVVYFDLHDIAGLQMLRDAARAEVVLLADSGAFLPSTVNANTLLQTKVKPYVPGGFVNYDLALTRTPLAASHDALLGVGFFAGTTLLTNNFALRDGNSVRLMSSLQTDIPQTMKTLRLGDTVNNTGAWGLGVLFAGVQYGTNFAVRPDFIAQSMPGLAGNAVLPSTVDVYVNNVLRARQEVPAGPFNIQNLPLVNGQGNMQVVVRDVLGREQVITQAFMASPSLLREGLVQESYEVGALRRNYGLTSNDYGDAFASATWRKGMSSQWSSELRTEVQPQTTTLGFSNAVMLPKLNSVLETTVAASGGAQDGITVLAGVTLLLDTRHFSNVSVNHTGRGIRFMPTTPKWQTLVKAWATVWLGRKGMTRPHRMRHLPATMQQAVGVVRRLSKTMRSARGYGPGGVRQAWARECIFRAALPRVLRLCR